MFHNVEPLHLSYLYRASLAICWNTSIVESHFHRQLSSQLNFFTSQDNTSHKLCHHSNESSVSDINNGSKTTIEDVDSKIETYTKFLENRNTIMGLIYKDLEPLFYQLA